MRVVENDTRLVLEAPLASLCTAACDVSCCRLDVFLPSSARPSEEVACPLATQQQCAPYGEYFLVQELCVCDRC